MSLNIAFFGLQQKPGVEKTSQASQSWRISMQLKDPLIENFIGLFAGQIEHFNPDAAGVSPLIDKTLSQGIDHDSAGERDFRRHRALSRTEVGGIRLERGHVLERRANLQSHIDAVAGAAMMAGEWDVDSFGNILGQ